MLTEEYKSELNSKSNPCYVISKDYVINYMNPAAVGFTPKGAPGANFLSTLCGRKSPCNGCPLLNEIGSDSVPVQDNMLCSFANVIFSRVECDDELILSSWKSSNDPMDFIPEINMTKALEALGGSRDAYNNILEVYYQEGEKKSQVIMNHYNNRDYYNLRIEVHGLKGTSYVIGADHLGDFAKKLEFACRDIEANEDAGKVSLAKQTIDNELDALLAEYKDLLCKLSNIYGPYADNIDANNIPELPSNEETLEHVKKSLELLESFELEDAQKHLEMALEELENDEQKAYISNVLKSLTDFNYDEASKKVRDWLK